MVCKYWVLTHSEGCWLKIPHGGPLFSSISTSQGKTMANPLLSLWLRGSTIAAITPMRQACTCGPVLGPGLTPSAPKQLKWDVHVKTLSVCNSHWQNPRKKSIASAATSLSISLVSVHWRAQCHTTWPRLQRVSQWPCKNWTHVALLTATCLNHWALGSYLSTETISTYIVTSWTNFLLAG